MTSQVFNRGEKERKVLVEVPEANVARVAQQAANLTSHVVVVNVKTIGSGVAGFLRKLSAYCAAAFLGFQKSLEFFVTDAVVRFESIGLFSALIHGDRSVSDQVHAFGRKVDLFKFSLAGMRFASRFMIFDEASAKLHPAILTSVQNPSSWSLLCRAAIWMLGLLGAPFIHCGLGAIPTCIRRAAFAVVMFVKVILRTWLLASGTQAVLRVQRWNAKTFVEPVFLNAAATYWAIAPAAGG